MPGVLTPAALIHQMTPGQLALHGDTAVYTLRRVVDGVERTELWTVSLAGGDARPLVSRAGSATCPRIAPDGGLVAFLASEDDAPAQVHLVPLDGGDSHAIAGFPRGAHDLAWYPDGSALVVLAEDAESGRVVRAPGLPAAATATAIRLTTVDWRSDGDGDGGLRLHPRHLHRVPLDGSRPARLTAGDWSAALPRVDSAGAICFLADRGGDADLWPAPQVHRIDAATRGAPEAASSAAPDLPGDSPDAGIVGAGQGTRITQVTAVPGGISRYHFDGTRLLVLAQAEKHAHDEIPPRWFAVDPGTGDLAPLGDGDDRWWWGRLGDETDLHDWTVELDDCAEVSVRSRDGSTLPAEIASGAALVGGTGVCGAIAADGGRRVAVLSLGVASDGSGATSGTGAVSEKACATTGAGAAGETAGAVTDLDATGEGANAATDRGPRWASDLYALDATGPRRLTDHGAWLQGYSQPAVTRTEFDGPAGPITTYLIDPPDGIACRATVLLLHGGPTGQWAAVPPVEAILLASVGYRVALPNIRGSIDRGAGHVAGLGGAWGSHDVADVIAVTEHLLDQGLARAGALGVLGLSYGGFLTQCVIGKSNLFAAAVAENGVANQISAWAGSDLGPSYNRAAHLADPLTGEGVQQLWDASPLKYAARITTPLLLLQGADDRTCPASDNEQLFVALRALGRTVEYVLYPEESHLMQATARLDRRIDRHVRVIAWFDTYLRQGSAL